MEEVGQLLAGILRIAAVPLVGYAVVRLARRRPLATLGLLLVVVAAGSVSLGYARGDGFEVDPTTRRISFHSPAGRWCFSVGGLALGLGVPAVPLVAVAHVRNGAVTGPIGGQWAAVLFGYFLACGVLTMALYSWITGIVK